MIRVRVPIACVFYGLATRTRGIAFDVAGHSDVSRTKWIMSKEEKGAQKIAKGGRNLDGSTV